MRYLVAQLLNADKLPQPAADQASLDRIFSIIFVTLGALAILLLIIGGLRYITARGEPEKITGARNMIMYTLIGLVIAAMASTLVYFLLGQI